MVNVTLVVTLPTNAPADVYVEQVTLQTPLVAFGIWVPKDVGGVNVTVTLPAAEKLLPMLTPDVCSVRLPKAYATLCLKLLVAGFRVIVIDLPISTLVAEYVGEVDLAMVGKVQEPLPVELYEPPYSKAPPQDALKEPLPLASCLITVVPLKGVVPLYETCASEALLVTPFTVTYLSRTVL